VAAGLHPFDFELRLTYALAARAAPTAQIITKAIADAARLWLHPYFTTPRTSAARASRSQGPLRALERAEMTAVSPDAIDLTDPTITMPRTHGGSWRNPVAGGRYGARIIAPRPLRAGCLRKISRTTCVSPGWVFRRHQHPRTSSGLRLGRRRSTDCRMRAVPAG
jgi:hypothetical protein